MNKKVEYTVENVTIEGEMEDGEWIGAVVRVRGNFEEYTAWLNWDQCHQLKNAMNDLVMGPND